MVRILSSAEVEWRRVMKDWEAMIVERSEPRFAFCRGTLEEFALLQETETDPERIHLIVEYADLMNKCIAANARVKKLFKLYRNS